MKLLHLALIGGGALLLLQGRAKAETARKAKQKAAADKAREAAKETGQDPIAAIALAHLAEELQSAYVSPLWSDASKIVLHLVEDAIHKNKAGEAPALALLRGLPETERATFAKAVATGRAGLFPPDFALGYAWGAWLYLHFGGVHADAEAIKVVQDNIGAPVTGQMDSATIAKVRDITGQEIWPLVLKP